MKKRRIVCLTLAVLMLMTTMLVTACGNGGGSASENAASTDGGEVVGDRPHHGYDINNVDTSDWVVLDLNYATFLAADNPSMNMNWTNQLRRAQEMMPGYFDFTLFHSGTLLTQGDTWEGIISGVADIGFVDLGTVPELLPLTSLWAFPSTNVGTAAAGSAAFNEWVNILQPAEFNDVVILSVQAASGNAFNTGHEINRLEDLAGRQISGTPALHPKISALGAVPLSIPTADVYEAARTGLIDGIVWTVSANVLTGAYTYLDHAFFTHMGVANYQAIVMNRDLYERLPRTQREFIREAFRQAFWEYILPVLPRTVEFHVPTLEVIQSGDFRLSVISPEEHQRMFEAVGHLREEYVQELEARGVADARRAVELIDELTEKWREWYSVDRFLAPFYAAQEGRLQEYIDDPSRHAIPPLLEIYGYIPLERR